MTAPALAYYYSGNYYSDDVPPILVQNDDPELSFGGQISTYEIPIQAASFASTTISGVTIVGAVGIAIPTGLTSYLGKSYSASAPTVRQFSFQVGTATVVFPQVAVSASGRYYLQDRSGAAGRYLVVDVNWSLVGTTTEWSRVVNITTAQPLNVIFADVPKADSVVGATDYRCIYFKNTSTVTVTATLTMTATNALAPVSFGVESLTPNSYGTHLADRFDSTGLLTVLEWLGASGSLSFTLAAGQWLPIWFRRQVPNLNAVSGTQSVAFSVVTV